LHPPAVHLDDLLHDGEAEAEAAARARRGRVFLTETLEELREELGRDADPFVAYDDLDTVARGVQHDLDPAALRRELDRVVHQVPHDLLQARRVAPQDGSGGIDADVERDALALRRRSDAFERGL